MVERPLSSILSVVCCAVCLDMCVCSGAGDGGGVFLSSRKIGHIYMFNIVFFSKMVYVNTVECNGGAQ